MSTDEKPAEGGDQAVDIDEVDESRIPTAPMRAVPPGGLPAGRPFPPIDFDDDDDDLDDEPRIGTRENPYTITTHPEIGPPAEVADQLQQVADLRKPNMAMVGIRVMVLLGVLGAVGAAILKFVQG